MRRERLAISPEEYHELDAFGSGDMHVYSKEGLPQFWAKCIAKTKERPHSAAFDIGSAFHEAMRDPSDWRTRFVEEPTIIDDSFSDLCDRVNEECGVKRMPSGKWNKIPATVGARISGRPDTHKRLMEIWHEQQAGKILPRSAFKLLESMIASVLDNTEAAEILADKSSLNVEVAYVLEHPSGVRFKAMIDLDQELVINDYKTTRFARMEDFIRQGGKKESRRLLNQCGHYCFVTGKRRFRFISVRNEEPFECNVFEVPEPKVTAHTFQAEKRAEELCQLIVNSQMDSTDSQGMPLSFHGELWGTVIPFDLELLGAA